MPQIGGMFEGDRSRKQTLVDYGFRLPSALDNRPQTFQEFLSITPQLVFVSATPGEYERTQSTRVVEQIVRPTGIVDPAVEVRETKNQIDDLMNEVRKRVDRNERVLVTTLTKKMSEDLSQYLLEMGFKTRYLHSEIDTLERIQIIRDLRLGEYDVLVGVNLLREGLDLPEVSLVAILDADKEGFLRGETSLIQTIGRAARNIEGTVLMYADKETRAMRAAISETDRRREIQLAYNEEHGITAATIVKGISDIAEFLQAESKVPRGRKRRTAKRGGEREMPKHELERMVVELEEEMIAAADDLRFEYAAQLRDELRELRRDLQEIRTVEAPAGEILPQRDSQPATWLRMPAVDFDRQSIERRDFPIGRRGYDPAAVDAHLRALADEYEELQRAAITGGGDASVASTAGTQVQSILQAAETAAAEIERHALENARQVREDADRDADRTREEAVERARQHVAAVAQVTARLLEHVGSMDGEVERARGEHARRRRAPGGRPVGGRDGHERALRRRLRARRRGARSRSRRVSSSPQPPQFEPEPQRRFERELDSALQERRRSPWARACRQGAGSERGRQRPRRRSPDRAEHGAQRRVARGHRALSRRELPAARSAEADRRGLLRDRGVGRARGPRARVRASIRSGIPSWPYGRLPE